MTKKHMRFLSAAAVAALSAVIASGCKSTASHSDSAEVLSPRAGVPPPFVSPTPADAPKTAAPAAVAAPAPRRVPAPARAPARAPAVIERPTVVTIPVRRKRPAAAKPPAVAIKEPPRIAAKVGKKKPATQTYTVKKGDTLWGIGRMYGVTYKALAAANKLDPEAILPQGKVLTLPADAAFIPPEKRPKVKPVRKPKTVVKRPIPANGKHTVKKGDTLWDISRSYSLKVSELMRWNGLTNDRIMPGAVLVLKAALSKAPVAAAIAPAAVSTAAPAETVAPGETKVPAPAAVDVSKLKCLTHIVDDKDTLAGIARMYGSKPAWIIEVNATIKSDADLKKSKGVTIQVPCPELQ
jgi:LysM repeat protein